MPLLLLQLVFKFYNVKIDLLVSTKSAFLCISCITFETAHITMPIT